MGGDPYQELTPIPQSEHQDLHHDLNQFLEQYCRFTLVTFA
jgi:hypothetical protein